MHFELTDECLLKVSSAALAGCGLWSLTAPAQAAETYFGKMVPPVNEAAIRWSGMGFGLAGAQGWGVAVTSGAGGAETRRNALKAQGVGWLLGGMLHAWHSSRGEQEREVAMLSAATYTVLGAACLWRGLGSGGGGARAGGSGAGASRGSRAGGGPAREPLFGRWTGQDEPPYQIKPKVPDVE